MFSRFWIIFAVIILNSFSGRLPVSSFFVWFGGHLSCFFTCWVFLSLFILFRLLCLEWPFCRLEVVVPLYCGACSLWVGLDEWLVKVFWLGKLASLFWWVELDLFSLKCNEVSSSEFGVGLVWLLAACIFVLRVMFLCCWRISLVCLALKLVGSWVELGFSVWRLLNELLSIYVPWSQEFSGVLMFWI